MSKKLSKTEILNKCRVKHNNKYTYIEDSIVDTRTPMIIICPIHGEFPQTPNHHMRGAGCSKCNKSSKYTTETVIEQFKKVHGEKYSYDKVNFINMKTPVEVTCKIHGSFFPTPKNHKNGSGCPKCANLIRNNHSKKDHNQAVEDFNKKHQYKYQYVSEYKHSKEKIEILCPTHGKFLMEPNAHLNGQGCSKCSNKQSNAEKEIISFLSDIGVENIIERDMHLGFELDIYIPEYNLAIEYDGLTFHSKGSTFPNNLNHFNPNKHKHKTDVCEENGIQLLHIFENEWILNKEQWKSVIKNKLNKTDVKIYARDTEIKEIKATEASNFCEKNHLQGKNDSSLNYGLFYNNKLVSVMTFSKNRFNKKADYELVRFCTKLNTVVIGGASKLLNRFKKHIGRSLISYANRRWSDGNLYQTLGFFFSHNSDKNFFFFKHNSYILYSRQKFQKHKLKDIKDFDFDENKTALQNMFDNGYRQIFDSGNKVFYWY